MGIYIALLNKGHDFGGGDSLAGINFVAACRAGDKETAKNILDSRVLSTCQKDAGLRAACLSEKWGVINLILGEYIPPPATGEAFVAAAAAGKIEVVEYLGRKGVGLEGGLTQSLAFEAAASKGNNAMLRCLMEYPFCGFPGSDSLLKAAANKQFDTMNLIVSKWRHEMPYPKMVPNRVTNVLKRYWSATNNPDILVVYRLLNLGADKSVADCIRHRMKAA